MDIPSRATWSVRMACSLGRSETQRRLTDEGNLLQESRHHVFHLQKQEVDLLIVVATLDL